MKQRRTWTTSTRYQIANIVHTCVYVSARVCLCVRMRMRMRVCVQQPLELQYCIYDQITVSARHSAKKGLYRWWTNNAKTFHRNQRTMHGHPLSTHSNIHPTVHTVSTAHVLCVKFILVDRHLDRTNKQNLTQHVIRQIENDASANALWQTNMHDAMHIVKFEFSKAWHAIVQHGEVWSGQ